MPQTNIMGVPVIGCCDDLPKLFLSGFKQAVIAIGSIGNPQLRIKIFERLAIGPDSMIGMGSVVSVNLPESVTAYGNPCRIVKIK